MDNQADKERNPNPSRKDTPRDGSLFPVQQAGRETIPEIHGRAKSVQTSNGESLRVATLSNTKNSKANLRAQMRDTLADVLPDLVQSLETAEFRDKVKFAELLARYGVGAPEETRQPGGDTVQQVVILPNLKGRGGG